MFLLKDFNFLYFKNFYFAVSNFAASKTSDCGQPYFFAHQLVINGTKIAVTTTDAAT